MTLRLLSVHDVSALTGWSPLTIYKKSAAGEIPGRMKLGKHSLRFKESEIEAGSRKVQTVQKQKRQRNKKAPGGANQ